MPAALPEEVREMFGAPNLAYLATVMADGSPQVSPVWVETRGDQLWVNTAEGRAKPRNLRRDPRVALAVHDHQRPYSWAQVRGRVVEFRHEGAAAHISELSNQYLGRDYPPLPEGMERVIMVIEADAVSFALREAPGGSPR